MYKTRLVTVVAALAATGALTSPALASGGGGGGGGGGNGGGGHGGGGGGGTNVPLPAPPIPAAGFDGIGSGPVYIHESFGHAQRTRLTQNGSVVDVVDKSEVNGIRAEYPNNRTETWFGTAVSGAPSWKISVVGPGDPFEAFTPLQVNEFGPQDGNLMLAGAEPDGPDTRPAALIPFPAPADSASTVSADVVPFAGRTAIGFSSSSATNHNFETGGQAWLELDTTGLFAIGGNTGILRWTFHAGGATLEGTYERATFNRAAVSYDPVAQVATASVDGAVVASVPSDAQPIRYAGVEGSLNANVDNFTVRAGS